MPDIEVVDANSNKNRQSQLSQKLMPVAARDSGVTNQTNNLAGAEGDDDSGSEEVVKDPMDGVTKIRKRDKLKGLFNKVKNGVKATGSGIKDRLKSPQPFVVSDQQLINSGIIVPNTQVSAPQQTYLAPSYQTSNQAIKESAK